MRNKNDLLLNTDYFLVDIFTIRFIQLDYFKYFITLVNDFIDFFYGLTCQF